MTNSQDDGASVDRRTRSAALLAIHLVSQVLDEAYHIANAAKESGQPWRYLLKQSIRTSESGFADDEDESFEVTKDDLHVNNIEVVGNATSTPQKIAPRQIGCSEADTMSVFIDSTLMGQGDGEIEARHADLINSTSMFINHLFDMSDVERVLIDDTEVTQSTSEPNYLLAEAMNNIMDSYVSNPFLPVEDFPIIVEQDFVENVPVIDMLSRSDNSDYSLLTDVFVPDITRDVAFYIDENSSAQHVNYLPTTSVNEIKEKTDEDTEIQRKEQKEDFQLYEKAYMTLNRDYDQCSEDDGYPILQNPKEMMLQEVELMTANTSDDELKYAEASVSKPKANDEGTVSGLSGSRRRTLVRRCRIQGARLLSCLRGWWRRKTPGERKETRLSGLAVCPLSPNARQRASSLLDNRLLRSQTASPSRPGVWKFNTINEAYLNSNRWKAYHFDVMAEGRGDL